MFYLYQSFDLMSFLLFMVLNLSCKGLSQLFFLFLEGGGKHQPTQESVEKIGKIGCA